MEMKRKKNFISSNEFLLFYIHFIVESWKKKLQKQYLINQKNVRGACQQNNIDNVYTGENQYNMCKPFKIMQLGHLINNLAFTVTLECLSVLLRFVFVLAFLIKIPRFFYLFVNSRLGFCLFSDFYRKVVTETPGPFNSCTCNLRFVIFWEFSRKYFYFFRAVSWGFLIFFWERFQSKPFSA